MGINMRMLTKKLNKDVLDLYGLEAGMQPDSPLPLTTYKPDDPQHFIVNEPGSAKEGK
jgi:hypothetical protein